MDQPKIERVLKLMMLLTGRVRYTVDELAAKLNTTYRSIYRYLDSFKEAGLVVVKEDRQYYRLARESRFFKNISSLVHFTEEEAYIVNSLIEGVDDTNVIKQELKRKLATVYRCTGIAETIVNKDNAGNVNRLVEAIEEHKQVVLKDYSSSHSQAVEDRRVEPFHFNANYISVWCLDLKDRKSKVFKTERIGSVELLEQPWEFESEHRRDLMDVFRMNGDIQTNIKIKLGIKARNLLVEEYPLAQRDLSRIRGEKDKWLLNTDICAPQGAARFIVGVLDDVQILKGQSLKTYIKEYLDKYSSSLN